MQAKLRPHPLPSWSVVMLKEVPTSGSNTVTTCVSGTGSDMSRDACYIPVCIAEVPVHAVPVHAHPICKTVELAVGGIVVHLITCVAEMSAKLSAGKPQELFTGGCTGYGWRRPMATPGSNLAHLLARPAQHPAHLV
jgi:hypothetical protein